MHSTELTPGLPLEEETVAALNTAISRLEHMLLSGETTVTIDGTVTTVDLEFAKRQLVDLRRMRDAKLGLTVRKPRVATINCGGLM